MSKHVVFFGDPAGTRTPDLRLKRAASIVIQRFVTCEKVAILAGFSCFAFYSVLQNNSTFCNGVEFLLNYFPCKCEWKKRAFRPPFLLCNLVGWVVSFCRLFAAPTLPILHLPLRPGLYGFDKNAESGQILPCPSLRLDTFLS